MQELEYNLCSMFSGFNLYNLDNTDIETLIPFINYINMRNGDGTDKNSNVKHINGKEYRKVNANASWANSIF